MRERLSHRWYGLESLEQRLLLSINPLGDEFRVNSYTSGDQVDVSLDADALGNYVAVWEGSNNQGFATDDIYLQRFNAEGTPVGHERRVHPDWPGEQTNPDVAVANDGTFVVSWETNDDGDGSGVEARRFASDGSPLTGVIEVNAYMAGNQGDPEVAVNTASGEFVVVWSSEAQDGSGKGVYGQRFAANGTPINAEFRVNTHTNDDQSEPSVAMDAVGNFVVVWQSNVQDGSGWGVYGQRYASDGAVLGGEFLVNTYTTNWQQNPAVAMNAAGSFIVAWVSPSQSDPTSGVYAQRYAADGTPRDNEFLVNVTTDNYQGNPEVAVGTGGDFTIAWDGYHPGDGSGVCAQRYAADGSVVDSEFLVNSYTSIDQGRPALAFGTGGDFLIAWQSYNQDSSRYGIHAQLYGDGLVQADLVPMQVSAPYGANQGQTIDVAGEIRNQGSVDAGPFVCRYYLSTDSVITLGDTPLGGLFTVDSLGAHETYTDSRQIQVSQAEAEGEFFVGLLVDVDGEVAEADETNNGTSTCDLPTIDIRAAALALGDEFRVNTYTLGNQANVSLDADAAGNYVVVWQGEHNQGFGTDDIYLQRFNAEGTPIGHEQRVHPEWRGEQTNPDVAVADDGTFVVSWETDDDGDGSGIEARRFASDGSPLTGVIEVDTYTTGNQSDSEVVINGTTGEFVVVWVSDGQDGSNHGVYGQRFATDGVPLGSEFLVNTYTSNEQSNPAVAMDASGNFVVAWRSYGQDGSGWGVHGQRFASNGSALGGEFQVNSYTNGEQRFPGVAMDPTGSFVVTWGSSGQDGSGWAVQARRYAADGTMIGDEFQVNTYTIGSQYPLADSVTMPDNGGFLIAWQSYGQDGSLDGVYAQRYAPDGTPLGGEFRANTATSSYQDTPAVAAGADGDFLIAWQGRGQDGSGIHAQLYGDGLAQADLIPATVTVPDGANLGQTIDVSSEIRNQGGVDAGPFTSQYYVSNDPVITSGDTPLGEPFDVNNLDAYATHTDSRTLAVPDVVAGDWYVGIIVDIGVTVSEADEGNNVYQASFDEPTVNLAALPMIGIEEQANTTTADEQSQPAVGFDAAGSYVTVWQSRNQDGDGYGIFGQRFDAVGSAVGSEFSVNTTTNGDQRYPSVAVADDGRFVVAWESEAQDGSGWGVYARPFDADGLPVGNEFLVNTHTNLDQNNASVGIDGAGNFIVAWRSNGQDVGNNGGIYAQRYLADGTPNGTEFWVCSNASPDQHRPVVAMNDNGQFVINWDDSHTVYARTFLADATPTDDEFVVNCYGSSQQNYASAAIDASGNFVVAWQSSGQDGSGWGVSAQRFASNGTVLGEEFRVNTYTNNGQSEPSVAMDATGNFVISWHSHSQDGNGWGIFARRYEANGSPIGGEFRINQHTLSDQADPTIAMLDAEHFILAWNSDWQDGSSNGIYTQLAGISDVATRPNLTITELSVPGEIQPNQTVDLTLSVQNTGIQVALPSTLQIWLSDDDVFGNADDQDTGITVPVPQLLCDSWNNIYETTVPYTRSDDDPFGTDRYYYFAAEADVAEQLTEIAEDDNTRMSMDTRFSMPNLAVTQILVEPFDLVAGQQVDATVTVANWGDTSANASIAHLWLSDDNLLDGSDISLLIDVSTPVLASGESYEETVSFTWPTVDPFGTDRDYYVIAQTDVTDMVTESDEDNNTGAGSFHLQMPNLTGWVDVPSSAAAGENVAIEVNVRNLGDLNAAASELHVWLSDDNVIGNGDDIRLQNGGVDVSVDVPAMDIFGWPDYNTFQQTVDYTWPITDPFGTDGQYYFYIVLDVTDNVIEADETDNTALSNSFGINRPNLLVYSLTTPSQVQPGEDVTATVRVKNTGTTVADASTLRTWLSDDDIAGNNDDWPVGGFVDVAVDPLAVNEIFQTDVALPWPTTDPFGTDLKYHLVVQCDAVNALDEGDEDDNFHVSNEIQVLMADLKPARLWTPTTVQLGEELQLQLGLHNKGLLDAPQSTARVRLSDNDVFGDADDVELALPLDLTVNELAAGETLTLDIVVPWPTTDPFATDNEYFITVQLDSAGAISESNESNNVMVTLPLALVSPATLDVTLAGHYGGASLLAAVDGDYAYEITSCGLRVLDISDPTSIKRVHETVLPVDTALAIHVFGDRLYATDSQAIRVFDIASPHEPILLGEHPIDPTTQVSVAFLEDIALVGDAAELQVDVFDLSNAATPILVSEYQLQTEPMSMAVEDDHLYVLYDDPMFQQATLDIVEISDLSQPTFVSRRTLNGSHPSQVRVDGNLLAVALSDRTSLVDVTDPAMPRLRGTLAVDSVAGMELSSDTLQLAVTNYDWTSGYELDLLVVDVSDPDDPAGIGSVNLGLGAEFVSLTSVDTLTYVGGIQFSVADTADRFHPVLVSQHNEPSGLRNIALAGSIACVVSDPNRIELIDVSDPMAASTIGTYTADRTVSKVVVAGQYLLALQDQYDSAQIELIDLPDPANPVSVGVYIPSDDYDIILDVVADGTELIVLAGDSRGSDAMGTLYVVDISDPANPVERSATELFLYADNFDGPVTYSNVYTHAQLEIVDGHLLVSNTHPDTSEQNDTRETATDLGNLSSPVVLSGVADDPEDGGSDYYRFTGTSGDSLAIALRGEQEAAGTLREGVVRLYDPEGSFLIGRVYNTSHDTSDGILNGYELPYTGDYFVQVESDYGNVGRYQLAIALNQPLPSAEPFTGMSVYSMVDPANPELISVANIGAISAGMLADGSMVYLSQAEPSMLSVWDYSDPAIPVQLGTALTTSSGSLQLADGLATISAGNQVQWVDVADPTRPVVLETLTLQNPGDIAIGGGLLYVAADTLFSYTVRSQGTTDPDLGAIRLTIPEAVQIGQPLSIEWTVRNHGQQTAAQPWTDSLYLSADARLDPSDILLGELRHTDSLDPLATYDAVINPHTAALSPGSYFVILHTDRLGEVNEAFVEGNNVRVSSLPVILGTPDLVVTEVVGPLEVNQGDSFDLVWSVKNHGEAPAEDALWTDRVFLSASGTLDGSEILVGSLEHVGGLDIGQSYQGSLTVSTIALVDLEYYLIVQSDTESQVEEDGREANNIGTSDQTIHLRYPDLTVTHIAAPTVIDRGAIVDVTWTVYNRSLAPTDAIAWNDKLWLSTDPTWDTGDTLLHSVPHTAGLAHRTTYQATASFNTAPLADGEYWLITRTDADNNLYEDGNEGNNHRAFGPVRVGVPTLTLDETLTDTFIAPDQHKYYRVDVPAGEHLFVSLDDLNDIGHNELYIKHGSAPTRSDYDARYSSNLVSDQVVEIPDTQPGTYYILAYADSAADAPADFELMVASLDFQILGVSHVTASNAGPLTMSIRVADLPADAIPMLVAPGGTRYLPDAIYQDKPALIYPTFDLSGVEIGRYDVRIETSDGLFTELVDFVDVQAGVGGNLEANLSVPSAVRVGRPFSIQIDYGNTGDTDILAPMFIVTATGGIELTYAGDDPTPAGSPLHVLGVSSTGPAGILRPGTRERIVIDSIAMGGEMQFLLDSSVAAETPIIWDDFKDGARRDSIDPTEWDTIWPTITANMGATWGDCLGVLGANATRRGQQGLRTASARRLFGMEIDRVLGKGISVISGTLWNTDTSQPIVNATVVARQEVTPDESILRAGVTDSLGQFIIHRVPEGTYDLFVEDYGFEEPDTYILTADTDILGQELWASPPPEEVPAELEHLNDSNPMLVVDALGTPHMVWKREAEIWHAFHDGSKWVSDAIPGAVGSRPTIASGDQLIDGTSPGVVVSWMEGLPGDETLGTLGHSDIYYTVGQWNTDGTAMKWSEAQLLSGEAIDECNVALGVTPDGQLVTVFQKVSPDIADDTDLYYDVIDIDNSTLTWSLPMLVGSDFLFTEEIAAASGLSFSYNFKKDLGTFTIPKSIPIAGGTYGGSISGKLTGSRDCTASLKGELDANAQFGGDGRSIHGGASGEFKWQAGCNGTECVYIFDSGNLAFTVGGQIEIPVFAGAWGVVSYEVGATMRGDVGGSLEWQGGSFPGWPTGGDVSLLVAAGLYGSAGIGIPGTWLSANATVGGEVGVEGTYDTFNKSWSAEVLVHLYAEGGIGPFKAHWDKTWTWPKDSTMMAAVEDDGVTITVDPWLGTDSVHGGNSVLADVASSLRNDGTPSLVVGPTGETLLAWTRDSETPASWLGSEVVVSMLDSGRWTTPVSIPGSQGFNSDPMLLHDSLGQPILVWAMADSSTVDLGNSAQDIMDAMGASNLVYSTRIGGAWSTPVLIADTSGPDGNIALGAGPNGEIVASWLNDSSDATSLYTVVWDGVTWSTSETVATGAIRGAPTVGTISGQTTVIWAEDLGTADSPELTLLHASHDESTGTWTTPSSFVTSETVTASGGGTVGPDLLESSHLAWVDSAPPDGTAETVITYFVDPATIANPERERTIQRIRDAAVIWNETDAMVTLSEVGSEVDADIYVHFSDTSASGNADNGILASFEYAVSSQIFGDYSDGKPLQRFLSNRETSKRSTVITFLNGWQWHVGLTEAVPTGQHDLQTVAVHEFGHALGLGHSQDPASPMHGTFTAGTSQRLAGVENIEALRYLYGGADFVGLPVALPTDLATLGSAVAGFSIGTPPDKCCEKCKEEKEEEDDSAPPEPDDDDRKKEDEETTIGVQAFEPNDKTGPAGTGVEHYVLPGSLMPYTVFYENDAEKATAPAMLVEVEDYLDDGLDWATFELGDVNLYGDFWIDVSAGLQHYETLVDLRPEGKDLLVELLADFDSDTGLAYWSFQSLDPDTMEEPLDPYAGFLSHLNENDANDGSVDYFVRARDDLVSGTVIENVATSTFDRMSSDITPTVFNTIDAGPPTAAINTLPAQVPDAPFDVSWTGQDDAGGSGIATYAVYVKRDDGDWEIWIDNSHDTSAQFTGVGGHGYEFRVVATDGVGLVEDDPGTAEASTSVDFSQLRVDLLETVPSGFVAHFKRTLDASRLNLYDVEAGTFGAADFVVVGDTVGTVAGSLVYNDVDRTVTFIKTGGPLEPDNYTITLRSAADGFTDAEGYLLDGDGDDVEGGDYVTTATVQPTTAKMLSVPDFTRGPGQPVDVPATGFGLPITVDNGVGVESVDMTLTYDPDLLTVIGAVLGRDAPAGSAVHANLTQPGRVDLSFYSLTPLPFGLAEIVTLVAEIPTTAVHGRTSLIRFTSVDINEGNILAKGEEAIHLTGFLGETTGNQQYSGLDAQRIARVAVELDSGFAAFPMVDPVVIADITGNGALSALDANRIAQEFIGFDRPEIPPLPGTGALLASLDSGPSRTVTAASVYLPRDLTAAPGNTVAVPMRIDDATDVEAIDVRITHDPSPLSVVEILPGSAWPDANTAVVFNVDETTGRILVAVYNPTVAAPGAGDLLEVSFQVAGEPTVTSGQTVTIDLRQVDLNEGNIPVDPAPIPGDDPTDGLLTIIALAMSSRFGMSLVFQPTSVNPSTGETAALPVGESWLDEWTGFWMELWVSNPTEPIADASVDLAYVSEYFVATDINYGPAFTSNQSGTIDNTTGLVDGIKAGTTRTDVGDNQPVLFARVLFEPVLDDQGVPLLAQGQYPQTVDNSWLRLEEPSITVVGNSSATVDPLPTLNTDLLPVLYDIDDTGRIDFGDLAYFAAAFQQTVGDPGATYAYASDFDRSGKVDFGDLAYFAANFQRQTGDGLGLLQYPNNFPDAWQTAPLTLAATAAPQHAGEALTETQLAPIAQAAIARVASSGDSQTAATLGDIRFEIVDLPHNLLGRAVGQSTIQIDINAAAHGWFIDLTPWNDLEFAHNGSTPSLTALPDTETSTRADLLTTVMHELGHLLGHEHSHADSLMAATLPLGTRRLLDAELDSLAEAFEGEREVGAPNTEVVDKVFAEL